MIKRLRARRNQSGYTLIELIISLTILATITGATTAAFLTANNANADVSSRIHESNDAQITAGFFTADAQAAGGNDPATGSVDTGLGVFTSGNGGCAIPGGDLVVGFKWKEWSTRIGAVDSYTTRVAQYVHHADTDELERRTCANGAAGGALTLATKVVARPTVSCAPGGSTCPSLPDTVTLNVTEATGYPFSLTAAVRSAAQTTPGAGNAAGSPLLALGSAACSSGTTGLSVAGNTTVVVNGQAAINAVDVGTCTAMTANGSITYAANGTSLVPGGTCSGNQCPPTTTDATRLGDPFASLPVPGTCGGGGSPATGHPGVYNGPATVTGNLLPGVYTFCSTVSFTGTITGTGVLFYFAGASSALSLAGNVNINVSAATTGDYAGLLIWNATTNAVTINGNGSLANYNGALYSPNADVTVAGTSSTYIGMIIAKRIFFSGNHVTDITNGQLTPGAPSLTSVATSTSSTRGVTITWDAPGYTGAIGNPVTGYQYRVDTGTGYSGWTNVTGATGGPTTYTAPITCGTSNTSASSCKVQVRALNALGNGTASNEVTGDSLADATAPRVTAPAAGTTVASVSTFTGSKWNGPGDSNTVTVMVYAGATCTGSPQVTFPATSTGLTWSVTSPSLGNGSKCAQASQVDFTGTTVTGAAVNFTVGQVRGITLVNNGGANGAGKVEKGDAVVIQFAQAMTESTICSTWSGTGDQSIAGNNQVTVTITNGTAGANDVLTVASSTCTTNVGSIDLGSPNWVSANTTFAGTNGNKSSITYGGSGNATTPNTLTITLGALTSGTAGTGVAPQTVTYTPGAALRDATNAAITGIYAFVGQRF